MKKVLSLLLVLTGLSTYAQDTITTYFDRATNYTLIDAPDNGYLFGTGYIVATIEINLSDASGMYFSNAQGGLRVTDMLVWFGNATVSGTPETVDVKIYNAGLDSLPLGTALETVGETVDNIVGQTSSPSFTRFTFPSPATVSGNFFVEVNYGTMDDTLGIMTSDLNAGDGLNEKRLRLHNVLLNSWYKHGDVLSFGTESFTMDCNADAMILPVIAAPVGMNELEEAGFKIYPYPASEFIYVETVAKEELSIYNVSGQFIERVVVNGKKQISLDKYVTGTYFIKAKSGAFAQRFEVIRPR